jgi:hypothetical protein
MTRSRPPSRLPGAPRPGGPFFGGGLRGPSPCAIWTKTATHLRLVVAISLCILAGCALFVPGLVLGAEEPANSLAEPPALVLETPDTEPPASEVAAADVAADAAVDATAGTLLITLPWGSGDGQVGLRAPAEGLTQGPEALAVAPDGRVAVLDSVNRRVLFLDPAGQVAGSAAVPLTQARFLAVDDERLYVLDCDTDRRLAVLDWSGSSLGFLALPGLPDVVTGLFATVRGPCVEVAHRDTYLVSATGQAGSAAGLATAGSQAQANGTPAKPAQCSLRALAGRPMDRALGWVANVTFSPGQNPRVRSFNVDKADLKPTKTDEASPSVASGRAIEHLVSVDGDGKGGLIIGARLLEPEMRDGRPAYLVLSRLAAAGAGAPAGAISDKTAGAMDTMFLVESSFAYLGMPYVVAPDGRVFQPSASDAGYSIYVHAFSGEETGAATREVQP